MAKRMSGGYAYMVGLKRGPIKIGFTSKNLKQRLGAARRDMGNNSINLLGQWPHRHAYLIEKFMHMYFHEYHYRGEWFDVSEKKAVKAIPKILELINSGWKKKVTKGNWFKRHGIPSDAVEECFGMGEGEIINAWYQKVFEDWALRKACRDESGEIDRRIRQQLKVLEQWK